MFLSVWFLLWEDRSVKTIIYSTRQNDEIIYKITVKILFDIWVANLNIGKVSEKPSQICLKSFTKFCSIKFSTSIGASDPSAWWAYRIHFLFLNIKIKYYSYFYSSKFVLIIYLIIGIYLMFKNKQKVLVRINCCNKWIKKLNTY